MKNHNPIVSFEKQKTNKYKKLKKVKINDRFDTTKKKTKVINMADRNKRQMLAKCD